MEILALNVFLEKNKKQTHFLELMLEFPKNEICRKVTFSDRTGKLMLNPPSDNLAWTLTMA